MQKNYMASFSDKSTAQEWDAHSLGNQQTQNDTQQAGQLRINLTRNLTIRHTDFTANSSDNSTAQEGDTMMTKQTDTHNAAQLRTNVIRRLTNIRKHYTENTSTGLTHSTQATQTQRADTSLQTQAHARQQHATTTTTPDITTQTQTTATTVSRHELVRTLQPHHRARDVTHKVMTRSRTKSELIPTPKSEVGLSGDPPKSEVAQSTNPSKREMGPPKSEVAQSKHPPKSAVKPPESEVKQAKSPDQGEAEMALPSWRVRGGTKRMRTRETTSVLDSDTEDEEQDIPQHEDPLIRCHLTAGARATRDRLMPLRDMAPSPQYRSFEIWAKHFKWAPSTKLSYWETLMTMVKAHTGSIPAQMKSVKKLLKKEMLCAPAARPTIAMTWKQMQAAVASLRRQDLINEATALETAYSLGQRLCDVTRVKVEDVSKVHDPATKTDFIALTFRESKTAEVIGPYTLHLPADSLVAAAVVHEALKTDEGVLFPPHQAAVRTAIKAVDNTLTILSIRRGGLQNMALAGISLQSMLHHSNHRTVAMLNHYLQHGLLNFSAAREVTHMFRSTPLGQQITETGRSTPKRSKKSNFKKS